MLTSNNLIAGVMWKTVSEACNLACDYCYYSTCAGKPEKIKKIDVAVLEKFIKEYFEIKKGVVPFAWQGGEPLLAGIDFFEKVIELQKKHAPKNTIVSNSIQTNGTLITKKWAQFFKKYHFLVGLSIDGPQLINDKRRILSDGRGSYDAVIRGMRHLQEEGVEFNVLTVIHEDNISSAKELMNFYSEHNVKHVQFIPCMDFRAQDIKATPKYHVSSKEYGEFLCDIFDVWYNNGSPEISIRFFDNMLASYLHQEQEMCIHQKTCPTTLILEQNGDAYPCDFFIHPDYKLGNVNTDTLEAVLQKYNQSQFSSKKSDIPEKCKKCEFLNVCNGGCPRNRTDYNMEETEYFCESYKMIYKYADDRMELLARDIKKRDLLTYVSYGHQLPARNEMCLCGSGKKFKNCCMDLIG